MLIHVCMHRLTWTPGAEFGGAAIMYLVDVPGSVIEKRPPGATPAGTPTEMAWYGTTVT